MTDKPPFRTGDHVFHAPSEETWVVAYADPATGYMSYLGWPAGEAKISDCSLTKAATDDEHQACLARLKVSGGSRAARALRLYGDPDHLRVSIATPEESALVADKSQHVDGPIIAWIGCGHYRPDFETTPIKLIDQKWNLYHFRFPSTTIAGLVAALARPEINPAAPAPREDGFEALRVAERALRLIVGEAPDVEPVYPEEGSTEDCEAWGMDQAYWNAAEIARPALAAARAALARRFA